jgi:hypothetical protein
MRIHNLKAPQEAAAVPGSGTSSSTQGAPGGGNPVVLAEQNGAVPLGSSAGANGTQALEIAFLKARIQHLELVVETARSLMGSNHERLLRRLHEVPRELVELSNQLRRVDIHATW